MKKKYKYDEPKVDKVEDPAVEYSRIPPGASDTKPPCQYSIEEMREGVRRAVKQFEEGKFYTDDELDDIILS